MEPDSAYKGVAGGLRSLPTIDSPPKVAEEPALGELEMVVTLGMAVPTAAVELPI